MFQMKSKRKYTMDKTVGKHKPSKNDSTRRRRHVPVSDRRKLEIKASQPKMVRVLLPSGKARMIREESTR
jgi:hypothetical protein